MNVGKDPSKLFKNILGSDQSGPENVLPKCEELVRFKSNSHQQERELATTSIKIDGLVTSKLAEKQPSTDENLNDATIIRHLPQSTIGEHVIRQGGVKDRRVKAGSQHQ
jgi:hypothetical protein